MDTTPVIIAYDKQLLRGNLIDCEGIGVTAIYNYEPSNNRRACSYNMYYGQIALYKNGAYFDYWSSGNYWITAESDGLQIGIPLERINDAYFYINETGQILFAGKNTPYYGHTNISELN